MKKIDEIEFVRENVENAAKKSSCYDEFFKRLLDDLGEISMSNFMAIMEAFEVEDLEELYKSESEGRGEPENFLCQNGGCK